MSTQRARASRVTDDEINDLILKLQALLPHSNQRRTSTGASGWRILKETCSYIKRLHREVGDLSERLSQLLDSLDNINGVEVEQLRSLLQR
ncbi:hypothetical protein PVL29_022392 [Vitis rotundifolia]|uniref:BHLH domain-containing protein n=1 Tax=Vitis rotundifolia TaxID=103349 RepID=A0AA38YVP6_VITRO|nr:hypothetical protein PVL29_022392 [Vitis rotundifolia]